MPGAAGEGGPMELQMGVPDPMVPTGFPGEPGEPPGGMPRTLLGRSMHWCYAIV